MVRRRNIRKRSAVRRPVRQTVRQMARTLSSEPHRFSPGIDPPNISRTYNFNHILVAQVRVAPKTGLQPFHNKDQTGTTPYFGCAYNDTFKSYETCFASVSEIFKIWKAWSRITPIETDECEIAILKVSYWGLSSPAVSGTVDCGLMLNHTAPYGSCCTTDSGGTGTRAKCGISNPFRCWYPSVSPHKIIGVDPDPTATLLNVVSKSDLADGFSLGTVHISLCAKLSLQ